MVTVFVGYDGTVNLQVFGLQTPTSLGDVNIKLTRKQARLLGRQLLSGDDGEPQHQQDPGEGSEVIPSQTAVSATAPAVPTLSPGATGT